MITGGNNWFIFRVNLKFHVIKAAKLYRYKTIFLYEDEDDEDEEDVVSQKQPADNRRLSGDPVIERLQRWRCHGGSSHLTLPSTDVARVSTVHVHVLVHFRPAVAHQ